MHLLPLSSYTTAYLTHAYLIREAAEVLSEVLTEGMPDSFFPSSLPFHTKDSYEVRAIASIQGNCATWQPQWAPFPEINVRVDVSVTGSRLVSMMSSLY